MMTIMQSDDPTTLSTGSDDILAKIEAVATVLSSSSSPQVKEALRRDYLDLVAHFLASQGRGHQLAVPLLDLVTAIDDQLPAKPAPTADRREGLRDASDELLARASAVVDVLISAGYSQDHACQVVTRQMISRGVRPLQGGDARAWRNLQAWRQKLLAKRDTLEFRIYAAFKEGLLTQHGSNVASIVSHQAVWDRRAKA